MEKVEKLKPFRHFCMSIGELPSSYLETMSYYEMLLWFTRYLQNTVIPTINNNATAVEELQALFIELKNYVDNYFENLDVQEEVNNKLDEMAEDGTLADIISQYLQFTFVYGFDSVSDMQSATSLHEGDFVKTYGFYSLNDGGKAQYKIRLRNENELANNMTTFDLTHDNTLIAELVYNDIHLKQFGCYADNIHDDTNILKYAVTLGKNIILDNGTYLISDTITVNSNNIIIDGDNSTVIYDDNSNFLMLEGNYITLKNLNINGNSKCYYAINLGGNYTTVDNLYIINTYYMGIMATSSYNLVKNVKGYNLGWDLIGNYGNIGYNTFENCTVEKSKRHGFSADVDSHDIKFINCRAINVGNPSLEENHNSFHFEYANNITVLNCSAIYDSSHENNTESETDLYNYIGILSDHSNNVLIDNFDYVIKNNYNPNDKTNSQSFSVTATNNFKIINSNFDNNVATCGDFYINNQIDIDIINTKLKNIKANTYSGFIKRLINCNIDTTLNAYFLKCDYGMDNAIIENNTFTGASVESGYNFTTEYFIKSRFGNCQILNNTFTNSKRPLIITEELNNANNKSKNTIIENNKFINAFYMVQVESATPLSNNIQYINNVFEGRCQIVLNNNYSYIVFRNNTKNNLAYEYLKSNDTPTLIFDDLTSEFDDNCPWTNLTLENTYTNLDPTDYFPLQFRKINGIVYVRGMINNSVTNPTGTYANASTLPIGCRPSKVFYSMAINNDILCSLTFTTNGEIRVFNTRVGWISIDTEFATE